MKAETKCPLVPCPSQTPNKCKELYCIKLGAKMKLSWLVLPGLWGWYPIQVAKANFETIFVAVSNWSFELHLPSSGLNEVPMWKIGIWCIEPDKLRLSGETTCELTFDFPALYLHFLHFENNHYLVSFGIKIWGF